MTITREDISDAYNNLTLVDFANHFYELGRKQQRESDAAIATTLKYCDHLIIEAIRNNTGDLT